MAIEVFHRYESKYLLNTWTFEQLERRLSDYMKLDAYNQSLYTYTITNLYYDTPDHLLIRTCLAKPKYREKLRLRAYGVPNQGETIFAEIKKKINGLTVKRRSALGLEQAYAFFATGDLPEITEGMNSQVLREIRYLLERHPLHPVLYLAYERRAYFAKGDHDLRISFDHNIRSRRYDLRLETGDFGELLLEPDLWLMELKVTRSLPIWLVRLLAEYRLYPASFSKYGGEYSRMLARQRAAGTTQREHLAAARRLSIIA